MTASTSEKLAATLKARAALRGIVLIESADDRGRPEYIATWNAMTKAFDSLDALSVWLDRVEGRAP